MPLLRAAVWLRRRNRRRRRGAAIRSSRKGCWTRRRAPRRRRRSRRRPAPAAAPAPPAAENREPRGWLLCGRARWTPEGAFYQQVRQTRRRKWLFLSLNSLLQSSLACTPEAVWSAQHRPPGSFLHLHLRLSSFHLRRRPRSGFSVFATAAGGCVRRLPVASEQPSLLRRRRAAQAARLRLRRLRGGAGRRPGRGGAAFLPNRRCGAAAAPSGAGFCPCARRDGGWAVRAHPLGSGDRGGHA